MRTCEKCFIFSSCKFQTIMGQKKNLSNEQRNPCHTVFQKLTIGRIRSAGNGECRLNYSIFHTIFFPTQLMKVEL